MNAHMCKGGDHVHGVLLTGELEAPQKKHSVSSLSTIIGINMAILIVILAVYYKSAKQQSDPIEL